MILRMIFMDKTLQRWKDQKLIRDLESYAGAGTSMITIFIKPGDSVAPMRQKLTNELGAASNIKSRVNRQSVETAIVSAQGMLRDIHNAPPTGLAIFVGEAADHAGKIKKISIYYTPPEKLRTGFYYCADHFQVNDLHYLIEDNETYGFAIVDGTGALFATVKGHLKTVIGKFEVDLPKKHNKGGQSSVRFARLHDEAVAVYIKKVAELMNRLFLTDERVNVSSIIIAGCGSKKDSVRTSADLDKRIAGRIVKSYDLAYGGEAGLTQAIIDSSEFLSGMELGHERESVQKFMNEIVMDTGKYCFGMTQTMAAIDAGAAETVIVWDELKMTRGGGGGGGDGQSLIEWLIDNHSKMGIDNLKLVSNATGEGAQFCTGFSGIGAILRWKFTSDTEIEETIDLMATETVAADDEVDFI